MPLTERQKDGIIALVVLATSVYTFNLLFPAIFPAHPRQAAYGSAYGSGEKERLAISLFVDGKEKGVYFVPPGATLSDFLNYARGELPFEFAGPKDERRLKSGDRVYVTGGPAPSIAVGEMSAAQALALNLALDINEASLDDLVLISGIGEKTAAKIIALRERKGKFQRLEELMEIKGIKEKRLAQLRKYFRPLMP